MFTRRHYKKAAETVKGFLESPDPIQPVDVVAMFVNMFKEDNPNFSEHKFITACGMRWEDYCQN